MEITKNIRRVCNLCWDYGWRKTVSKIGVYLHTSTKKEIHYFRRRFFSDWDHIRARLFIQSSVHGYQAVADPFKTIWISPKQIKYEHSYSRSDQFEVGSINNGDWDKNVKPFDDNHIYRLFTERFKKGKNWSNIEFIQQCKKGNRNWRNCDDLSDIHQRCAEMDELYEKIRKEGFKSKQEILGEDIHFAVKNGAKVTQHLDNIVVDIGRDGEFIFIDGKHRLAIAKILGVNYVPVNIIVRHKMWQKKREKISDVGDFSGLNDGLYQYFTHPDLADLFENHNKFDTFQNI